MKIYVASSIKNKEKVQELFGALKAKGYEVTTDWTLTTIFLKMRDVLKETTCDR